MATKRCPYGKVKSGPRKGRCLKAKRRPTVKGVCTKFVTSPRGKRRCVKRAQVTRRCVSTNRNGRCRKYEYDAKSVGFEGSGLLGLGLFGIL